ncbi:MAG: hypothetical protein CM15mP32_3640 [Flavobacteriaceae bacterium]|nr:MAG: hypothetical protein CM15mP32_3640 [Flavobacteriaceae bacterium]
MTSVNSVISAFLSDVKPDWFQPDMRISITGRNVIPNQANILIMLLPMGYPSS